MPFKLSDWNKMLQGLAYAGEQLRQFTEDPSKTFLLDNAVIGIWIVAGYAVNVMLELAGEPQEQRHRTADRATELRALGRLTGDYSKILGQLESYRLKAEHAGYVRNRSVHYSRKNVQDCFDAIERLRDEVAHALRIAKKIP